MPGLCPICHVADSTGPILTFDLFPLDLHNLSCSAGLSSESVPALSNIVPRFLNKCFTHQKWFECFLSLNIGHFNIDG